VRNSRQPPGSWSKAHPRAVTRSIPSDFVGINARPERPKRQSPRGVVDRPPGARRLRVAAKQPWPTDLGYFEREVAPNLASMPVRGLVKATGLSPGYCRKIRDGKVVPHPMWWGRIETSSYRTSSMTNRARQTSTAVG